MADETHPVIDLLIARIQSHPKEFTEKPFRWEMFVQRALDGAVEADHIKLHVAIAKVQMDKLHEEVMDELLNGEDRRAALAEQEKQAMKAAQAAKAAAAVAQQQALQQSAYSQAGVLNASNNYGFVGNSYAQAEPSLTLGKTTLTEQSLMEVIKNLTKGKGGK